MTSSSSHKGVRPLSVSIGVSHLLTKRLELIISLANKLDDEGSIHDVIQELYIATHNFRSVASQVGLGGIEKDAEALEILVKQLKEKEGHIGRSQLNSIKDIVSGLKEKQGVFGTEQNTKKLLERVSVNHGYSPIIFVVESDYEQSKLICDLLELNNFRTCRFNSLVRFKQHVTSSKVKPDAVLVDVFFPEGDLAGLEVVRELNNSGALNSPVIILSDHDDLYARQRSVQAGADRHIKKPFDPINLIHILELLVENDSTEPYRVLIVDDDKISLSLQKKMLESSNMEVLAITDPKRALEAIYTFHPELIVLDVYMPDINGPELAAIIREGESILQTPIIFLSSENDIDRQMEALSLGGDDFLVKPVDAKYFSMVVQTRVARSRQLNSIQKNLQKSLYERERERAALNQHAIVSVTDIKGRIIEVNDKFCEVSGYERYELIGENHRILKSGEHSPSFYRDMWLCISKGETWHGEICNKRKEGGYYWVNSTIMPLMDENGRPYQYVSIRTEVTEIKQQQELLNNVRQKLVATLESTADGVLVIDTQGLTRMANNNLYEMWEGEDDSQYSTLVEKIEQQLVQVNGSRTLFSDLYLSNEEASDILNCADGRVFECYSRPLIISAKVHGRVFSFREITARIAAEKELVKAKEDAESSNKAKSEFLSNMSHELRTPLNAIVGFTQLLLRENLSDENIECVKEIEGAGNHLLSLINEILDLSKIEAGKLELEYEYFSVTNLIEECLKLVNSSATNEGVSLNFEPNNAFDIRADKRRTKQILLNLLSNSVKYNKKDGKVDVSVEETSSSMVKVTVQDTGVGIPGDKVSELFQPFVRLEAEYSGIEGTGIGLALVKRIVEQMNGRVGAESVLNEGSRFWFELPIDPNVSAITSEEAISSSVKDGSKKIFTKKVLYIEDNLANLKLVQKIFNSFKSIELLTEVSPTAGIELAKKERPNLILLDINLPGMDGYQVLERLKDMDITKDIPVIAVTANAMLDDINNAKTSGFEEYVTKPIDIAKFSAMINKLVVDSNGKEETIS
ncbi:response regulator [Pleionea sediminis]|uniref:response regulator n=1 Tax=Pleionea sediminis TaxID=2569479 RepID=UPI00118534F3|nr:response regulator [Pleionea sediminis]